MSGKSRLSDAELMSAMELLHQLIPAEKLEKMQPRGPATIYTTAVTVWMMILQRLGGGLSLANVVKSVVSNHKGVLPDNKRLREETLSHSTTAFSRARSRFELETVKAIANEISDALVNTTEPSLNGRRVYLMDGTTFTLPPTPQLKKTYPPAKNQHGDSPWPLLHMLVAHELQSGCALLPQIGAMYGDQSISETRLSHQLAKELPRNSLVLGDSGFGIFSVAWFMHEQGHDFLLALTKQRFKALTKNAKLVEEFDGHLTYQLTWAPSKADRATNPDLPADASLNVLIHKIPIKDNALYLITGLAVTAQVAGDWYSHRYTVENDIRDVKVTLNIENIRATTEDMVRKELLTSLIAYNLVIQFRRQAAKQVNLNPRRLSFTGVWDTLQYFLLHQPACDAQEWERRFDRALRVASKQKLPIRPGRSYPRKAIPRRRKSTDFQRTAEKKSNDQTSQIIENPPPLNPK